MTMYHCGMLGIDEDWWWRNTPRTTYLKAHSIEEAHLRSWQQTRNIEYMIAQTAWVGGGMGKAQHLFKSLTNKSKLYKLRGDEAEKVMDTDAANAMIADNFINT